MIKKQLGVMGLSTVTAAVMSFAIIRSHPALARQFSSGTHTAFSAEQITKMYDNAGTLRHTMLSTFSQRGDGSWVDDRLTWDGHETGGLRVVVDLESATRTSTEISIKAKTTYNLTAGEVAFVSQVDKTCSYLMSDVTFLKYQPQLTERTTFLDRPVIKVVREGTSGKGETIREERWLAPSLNCAVVKEISTKKAFASDPGATTTSEFLSVSERAPDPALFQIDPSLTEETPSEAINETAKRQGRTCSSCEFAHGQLDQAYLSHQKH